MRHHLLLLALALAPASCAGVRPAPAPAPAPAAVVAPECREDEAFRDCAARVEAGPLARVPGRAWRHGDTLYLATEAGHPAALASDTTEGDPYIVFRYVEPLERERLHLVAYHLYEGRGYVLVDARSGRQVDLASAPAVSPGRTRFAVANADLWAGYTQNVIQVWRFADGPPVLEWGLDGGDTWGAEHPVWRSETELQFDRVERADDGSTERRIPMRLRMLGGGFEVRPRP